MKERGDDTTDSRTRVRRGRDGTTVDYYYDDGTGYEIYNPDEEEDEAKDKDVNENGALTREKTY